MKLLNPTYFPKSEKYSKIEVNVFLGISLILFIFLVIRAITVEMTHDEISTFFQYAQTGDFLPFIVKTDGNNHLLNTILTYLFYHLFGSSPLVLRLSNLVLAPLYFFFCYKLSEQLHSKLLGWVFFLTMAFSLHLIEFHALSRGYGLALTFMTGALWQFIVFVRILNFKNIYLSFLYIFLASLAILSLTYTYILISGFMFLYLILKFKSLRIRDWLLFLIYGVIPVVFLIEFSLFIKANGGYFDGNNNGLWQTTFTSLFMNLSDLGFDRINYLLYAFSIILIIPIFFILFILIRKGKTAWDYHLIFPFLLIGNVLITILSVKLLHLVYPAERMAFYFFPLIIGNIVFLIDMVIQSTHAKVLVVLAIPLLYFPVHFVRAVNFDYTTWYKYCHVPYRFYERVVADNKKGEIPPSVSSHGLQAYVWFFYIRTNDLKASAISHEPFPNHHTKYEIIELQYFKDWQKYYDTIDYDKVSNLSLLKIKKDFKRLNYKTIQNISTNGTTHKEYFAIYQLTTEKLKGKTIEAQFDFSIQSYNSLNNGGFVISIDSSGQQLFYEGIFLNRLRETWDGTPHNFLNSFVFDVPQNATTLTLYFWNLKGHDYSFNQGKINLLILED